MRKNEINVVFLKDIGFLLNNEQLEYLITFSSKDEYSINKMPLVFKNNLSTLYSFLGYDFDKLSVNNQKRFLFQMKKFVLNEKSKYNLATKKYIKK